VVAPQPGPRDRPPVRRRRVGRRGPGGPRPRQRGAAAGNVRGACRNGRVHARAAACRPRAPERGWPPVHAGHLVPAVLPVLWREHLGRHRRAFDRRAQRGRHAPDRIRRRPSARGLGRRTGTPRHRRAPRHPSRRCLCPAGRLRPAWRRALLTSGVADLAPAGTASALLAYCRPGFENECVQELMARAHEQGLAGYPRARANEAHALFVLTGDADPTPALRSPLPIFARQLLRVFAQLDGLPRDDRLTPIATVLAGADRQWNDVWVESPDSEAGRELAALCRSFAGVLRTELKRRRLLVPHAKTRLHVLFTGGDSVLLADADPRHASPFPGGIPRLRRLAGAPSRSAGKLEEAFTVMLDDTERERWLKPGMTAVDLGAAPGGWSWVLARRHVRVAAIDNGPLASQVIDSGLVTHIRADGFTWRPVKPVDWLVCDMVEQPARVAVLIGRWLADGSCRQALFNLKL